MLRTKILWIIIVLLLDWRSTNLLLVLSALIKIFILTTTKAKLLILTTAGGLLQHSFIIRGHFIVDVTG